MDWQTMVLESVKILGPVIVTAIVSIKISRRQIDIRRIELTAESEYKAREMIFKTYRDNLAGIEESQRQWSESYGKIMGQAGATEDQVEKTKFLRAMLRIIIPAQSQTKNFLVTIENKLKEQGLITQETETILELAKRIVSIDLSDVKDDELERILVDYNQLSSIISELQSLLISEKCEELFSKYIK